MPHIKITPQVESILRSARVEGNNLFLPEGQLERKLYEDVNKVLVAAGGRWKGGKLKAHVFQGDPMAKLDLALETGVAIDEKKHFQAFFTPPALAAEMVSLAGVSGKRVLEPSAGQGALIREAYAQGAREVFAFELNPENASGLNEVFKTANHSGPAFQLGDFLEHDPEDFGLFDRVVMNPPFTKNQDVRHVEHALTFLKRGGLLVAIMAGNTDRPFFRKPGVEWTSLPEGSFKESGTAVSTVMVRISR